ncbi:hypothetical protein EVAR_10871_1 [Eumeta japonica]|uniref:Uncharacterized protein n=1 Tax=Eumeta variegata TaxID=151549 RepID=A0A4C1URH6_EUMVA|nr:hypothetical protein EVAR_10871_1 [Eumeta japonica]
MTFVMKLNTRKPLPTRDFRGTARRFDKKNRCVRRDRFYQKPAKSDTGVRTLERDERVDAVLMPTDSLQYDTSYEVGMTICKVPECVK